MISGATERAELKRRSLLSPDWREEEEILRLASEQQALEPEELINPANGDIIPFTAAAA